MKRFVIIALILAALFVFQAVALWGATAAIAEKTAVDNAKYCSDRINDKVEQTLDLLISLSNTEAIRGEELNYGQKAAALTKISKQFGYMMIRILDSDLRVYNENASNTDYVSSDLSKRDYLQELKKTLEPQVTDAFLAGVDGKTVNFTVAVPIVEEGAFKGALFAAIYEADFASLLSENSAVLLGKKLQYMSGIEVEEVGLLLDAELEDVWLFGTTAEQRLMEIMSEESAEGSFSGIQGVDVRLYSYNKIPNADWNVVCRISFTDAIAANPIVFVSMLLSLAATAFLLIATLCNKKRLTAKKSTEPAQPQ